VTIGVIVSHCGGISAIVSFKAFGTIRDVLGSFYRPSTIRTNCRKVSSLFAIKSSVAKNFFTTV